MTTPSMVTWPSAFSQSDEVLPIVPVELITLADVTNIQEAAREVEQIPPEPELEPPIEAAPETAELTPPEPEPVPLPELESEPEPEAVVEAEPEPEPPPPTPVEKPEPQRNEFDLDSVIALLDSRSPPNPTAQPAEETRLGIGDRNAMTMNLTDIVRTQMYQCWSPPIGA